MKVNVENRATYDYNLAASRNARAAQASYGLLAIGGLIAVHVAGCGGSMAMAAPAAGIAAAVGLTLAFTAAIAAWTNWTLLALVHAQWADTRLLVTDGTVAEIDPGRKKLIADAAFAAAIFAAAGSAALIPVAIAVAIY